VSAVREAMIVAGGAGTRLHPLTLSTPKPMLPFCGVPLLVGMIRRLAAAGVRRVLLVVGPDPGPFASLGTPARQVGVEIEVVSEPEPLDTAGGVRSALGRVSGTFLVCNGDIVTDLDLEALVDAHRSADASATLALVRVDDTSSFGVCVLEGSRIVGFVEKPPSGTLSGQDAVNAGTYVLEPDALAGFPLGRLSFEREVFPALLAEGAHLEGVVSDAAWVDLGTPERFLLGHRLVLDGDLRWPTGLPVAAGVHRAADAVVEEGAALEPPVLLAPRARVRAGARVGPHAVVGPDAEVASGGVVVDSVLFARAHVAAPVTGLVAGTAARVEAGASVGAGVVLGDGQVVAAGESVRAGGRRPVAEGAGPRRGPDLRLC
jgi:mannose-1-phosphate guanylyltransferase